MFVFVYTRVCSPSAGVSGTQVLGKVESKNQKDEKDRPKPRILKTRTNRFVDSMTRVSRGSFRSVQRAS